MEALYEFLRTETKATSKWQLVEMPSWCFPKKHDGHRWVFVGV